MNKRNGCYVIKPRNKYYIGSIHKSKNYGEFKIIEYLGYNKTRNKVYKIKFINTGYELNVIASHIKTGSVKDHTFDYIDKNIGKIFKSNNLNEFKIMERVGIKGTNLYYKVKFIKSGYTVNASYANIISGKVKDKTNVSTYDIEGKIFNSNSFGKFKVLSRDHDDRFNIEFIDTKYKTSAKLGNILGGKVKDFLKPTVYNIGYLGNDSQKYFLKDKDLYKELISRWHSMMSRCYNKSDMSYFRYGGSGITVSKRWHNFSNFYNDAKELPGFNRESILNKKLQIDKDKFQQHLPKNKMIYSKDTCCWLTPWENNPNVIKRNSNVQRLSPLGT